MRFFDASLPVGRTNQAAPQSPANAAEAIAVMDRYDVDEAVVYHTVARDSDPELGNAALMEDLATLAPEDRTRLHAAWGFEATATLAESPREFVARAADAGVRAILVNPLIRDIRIDRSPPIGALAEAMAERRMPLLALYRRWDGGQDEIDWYELADFCRAHPALAVVAWQWRSRANRPMFDALSLAPNLRVSLASIWQSQMIECIAEAHGEDRVVFSLGLPRLDPASFQAVVAYADLPERAKAAVAGDTMRALMGGDHA